MEHELPTDDVTSPRSHRRPARWTKHRLDIQLVSVALLLYAGTDLWQNLSWPIFSSSDETLEIDYVYRLTLGQLPAFFDGQQYNPLGQLTGSLLPVQWRYQHPPLFYLLEVPVFLLFDATVNPIQAIWAMRVLVFVLGISLILVSRWVARWVLGTSNPLVSLVPLFVAADRCLGSVVFNYTLATLWVALLIGMTAKLIRSMAHVLSRSTVIAWAAIVLIAPFTRLSTVPIAGLCLLLLAISIIMNGQMVLRRCLKLIVLPAVLAVISSAWFYIRLYRLSGSITGSQPDWSSVHFDRNIHASFTDVLSNPSFWLDSLSQYQNMTSVSMSEYAWAFLAMLMLVPLTLGLLAILKHLLGHSFRQLERPLQRADIFIALMLVGALVGTIVQQMLFVMQGGSDNAVYFSLINIVFASLLTIGFLQFRGGIRVLLLASWLTVKLTATLYEAQLKWPVTTGPDSAPEPLVYTALVMILFSIVLAAAFIGSCRDIQFSRYRNI